ncbi:GNAT family N-acetyltransferase [Rhizobium sp. XQZ8]|uniref:GNAT family N-acetyltransferase n=1 Tax=Rhizobium populisoli TaxID=2859785 RepID=UPI001C678356|nr:GNAT family N-acetyltransferase [Rhizobium populisoli]MBW6420339.1 GNAT family N-acetyltransferase [Rhizobium populisoli]
MTTADHPAVVSTGFAAWLSSDAFKGVDLGVDVVERTRKAYADFPPQTRAEVYVADLDGEVIGWGARDGAPNYISDLWVHPDHQGKGAGKALLLHICDLIRSEGHDKATLHTQANNTGGIRLYERCGFVIVWRGMEHSKSMGIDLEKVHLEKLLDA